MCSATLISTATVDWLFAALSAPAAHSVIAGDVDAGVAATNPDRSGTADAAVRWVDAGYWATTALLGARPADAAPVLEPGVMRSDEALNSIEKCFTAATALYDMRQRLIGEPGAERAVVVESFNAGVASALVVHDRNALL